MGWLQAVLEDSVTQERMKAAQPSQNLTSEHFNTEHSLNGDLLMWRSYLL